MTFAPKGEEVLQAEALELLGLEAYEGNEEVVDRIVASKKADEDLKKSLHDDKMSNRDKLKEARKLLGQDPETGEKLPTNVVVEPKIESLGSKKEQILEGRALNSLHEDDIEEVVAIAEAKKISLSEAIKSPYVKAYIQTRVEERKTAEATQTGSNRKSSSTATTGNLLKKAEGYELSKDEMKEAAKAMIENTFGSKK